MAYENKFGAQKNSQISVDGRKIRDQQMVLYAMQGKTSEQIATLCNVSKSLVVKRLPELLDKETAKNAKLIAREITLQNGILTNMLSMALEQFKKSCEHSVEVEKTDEGYVDPLNPMAVTNGKTTKGATANPRRSVRTVHKQNLGDPRFLAEARQIMADKRKLLGIDQEEIREIVVNQFIKNEVNIGSIPTQSVVASVEEMGEMASIMLSLGIDVSGQPIIPEALPAPAEDDDEDDVIDGDYDATVAVDERRQRNDGD